jgi:hypothetical protein
MRHAPGYRSLVLYHPSHSWRTFRTPRPIPPRRTATWHHNRLTTTTSVNGHNRTTYMTNGAQRDRDGMGRRELGYVQQQQRLKRAQTCFLDARPPPRKTPTTTAKPQTTTAERHTTIVEQRTMQRRRERSNDENGGLETCCVSSLGYVFYSSFFFFFY